MKKITLLLFLLIFAICTYATSESITSFTVGSTANATINASRNHTFYIYIPMNFYISNFTVHSRIYGTGRYCMQSFYNDTVNCSHPKNGTFSYDTNWVAGNGADNIVDGDYSTYAQPTGGGAEPPELAEANISYHKPFSNTTGVGAFVSSLHGATPTSYNITMPQACYNRSYVNISVRSRYGNEPSKTRVMLLCWNGTDMHTIWNDTVEGTDGNPNVHDVRLFWNLTIINMSVIYPSATYNINETGLLYKDIFSNASIMDNVNNEIMSNCTCQNCTLSSGYCIIPITYNTYYNMRVMANMSNVTYSYGIDNCSSSYNIPYNATSLFINFKDLDEQDAIIDYAATLQYSPYDENYSYYSLQIDDIYNTSYCIYPYWANLTGNLQVEYTDIDGDVLNYFTSGTEFTNITQNLTLYIQNGTTEVLFTVLDNDGNEVEDAYIHILRYDVGTGTYTTTEVIKTDTQGQAIGNIVLISDFYNFLIYYDGNLVYSELGVKIIATTRTFTVNLYGSTWHDNYKNTLGVNTNLYFNDDTQNFVYIWTDPSSSMHYGCLKVDLRNDSGMYNLTDECEYTTSGTIIYNIPVLENGTTYIATGYLKYDDMQITDVVQKVIAASRDYSQQNPMGALLLAFCAILVLFTIGIPNPSLAITLMGAGVLFSAIFGFYAISSLATGSIIVLILVQLYISGRQQT